MSKYLSTKLWQPSDGFITTETVEKTIKEDQKNLGVLAGPGAGKTEILAQRASFLLQIRACKSPQKILALSFKGDAANNIKKRVNLRCGKELARRFDSSTFDAFFISLVRRFSCLLPQWVKIPQDFDIYSFDKNWWENFERTELDGQPCKYKATSTKHNLHAPLDLSQKPDKEMLKIWNYCAEKKIADYHMCRSMAFTIIKNHKQVKNLILSTYKYLFLDEFQDTTDPQYDFVKTIFKDSDTIITAVGDTNQMIMGWAGANPKNFENFKNDFNSEIISLAINHRSNPKIIELINHVIKDLTPADESPIIYKGTRKDVPYSNCIGGKIFDSIDNEAIFVSKYINYLIKKDPNLLPNDFALILRQKAKDYFDKAVNAFESNALNLRNEDALVFKNGVTIQDLMSEPIANFWILLIKQKIGYINYTQEKDLESIVASLTGYDLDKDRDYRKLKEYIHGLLECVDLSNSIKDIFTQIINNIGKEKIKSVFPQYRSQYLNKVYESFYILFQNSLDKEQQNIKKAIENYEGVNQVKLMTIHKSKGLEFNTVFFVNFNHKAWWALKRAVNVKNQEKIREEIREEKSSFFVGLSRAKENLFFTKSTGKWPPIITDLLNSSKLVFKMDEI